jgi:DNA-binding MarR family transcriptional regulator
MNAPAPQTGFVDDYLLYLLARASHQVSRQFHAVVRTEGLQVPEWRVLARLADGPVTVGELADVTLMQQPTLTKILDRMAAQDLVTRRRHGDDGRKVLVESTPAGRQMVDRLLAAARRHEAETLADYDADEVQALKRALKRLIAATR